MNKDFFDGRALVGMFAWLFLWFIPWQDWLGTNLWLKVGIALAIFITPGGCIYLLARGGTAIKSRFITSGFVYSHLLMAVLGLTGRFFQFPFLYVKNIFLALGLVLIATSFLREYKRFLAAARNDRLPLEMTTYTGFRHFLRNWRSKNSSPSPREWMARYASTWPLAILTILTMLMTVQRVLTSDDLAYLAHLTNWQSMPNLNFGDVYFDVHQIESTRFWLVSTPFSQAFLAEIAKIPGLVLLSGYYEPFLALLSILCTYDLARTLGLAKSSAMASVAVQVMFMALLSDYLHPGAPFFHQLSTDKATAAFILTPVFIASTVELLRGDRKDFSPALEMTRPPVDMTGPPLEMTTPSHERRTYRGFKRSRVFQFMLSGLSLSFMHPILSAFAVFIAGAISFFGINRENFKRHLIVILLAALTLAPQVGIRLIEHEAQPKIPNDISSIEGSRGIESMISRLGDTRFYGFNPAILEMRIPYLDRLPFSAGFMAWIWIAIPILALLFSLRGLRNNILKQYILAATLLVLMAGIPFTGWILGYFVSAWMLERTTWLYPFGISAIFLLVALRDRTGFGKKLHAWKINLHKALQLDFTWFARASVWTIALLSLLLVMRQQGLPDVSRLQSSTARYQELALAGQHIDQNTQAPVNMVGTDELNDFIPVLSWKAKAISYRPEDTAYPYFFTEAERARRWSDRQTILSREIAPGERMELLRKYDVRYVLIESYRLGWFKDLISTYPTMFRTYSFGRYNLIEILQE